MPLLHSFATRAPVKVGRRQFLGAATTLAALLPAGRLWADESSPGALPTQIAAV